MRSNAEKIKIDFIGIGAAKSGTTLLAKLLEEHPEICISQPKEVNFFNQNFPSYLPTQRTNYENGWSWYEKHFKHCPQNNLRGEFSVYYLPDPTAARLIALNYPKVKIIAILRNPTDRAFSHYQFRKSQPGKTTYTSFEDALQKNSEFIEWGFYFKQLQPYFKLFDQKNIYIIIFENFVKNTERETKKLCRWLGVNNDFQFKSLLKKINSSQSKRGIFRKISIKTYNLLAKNKNLENKLKKLHGSKLTKFLEKIDSFLIFKKSEKISEQTRKTLNKIYKSDIEKLEKALGINLNLWKD